MKFAVVVVLCALAFGAHASVLPLIATVQGPAVVAAHAAPGSVAIHASAVPLALSPAGPVQIISSPAVWPQIVAAPPAVVAVAAPAASYVAKTRGAVHVAPLPGHSQSAASVNLEPAPGTL